MDRSMFSSLELNSSSGSRFLSFVIFVCIFLSQFVKGDVIMMGPNGMPSIIENDDIEPDVILMPGMSNMLINEDLVL